MTISNTVSDQQKFLLQQRTRELQTLVRVAQLINVIDLDYVLSQTLQLMTEVSGANKGSFFLIDAKEEPVQRFITQRDMPPEISRQVARHVIEKGLAGWCVRHKTGAIVDDVNQDERWYVFPDDDQTDVISALCVPVLNENQLQGVITLVHSEAGHFKDSDLQLVSAMANQASSAIRNAQLFDDLQSKQHQLELVLEKNSEALLTVDDKFRITLINPEGQQLSNSTESLTGKRLDDLDSNSIFPDIFHRLEQAPQGTYSLSFEIHDEPHDRDFAVSISALISGDIHQGYVITIHDITSIKELDRLKTNMLHMLSHDLKNPMNMIWGYVDLLRIDSQSGLSVDPRFVDGILRALQRMENLIEETLGAARLLSAGYKETQHPFLPSGIIQEAVESLQQLAENKKQTLVRDIQPDLPKIVGTPFQLREAMVNLISNAIKYTPEGGTITVHANADADRLSFYVRDTGMGIPANLQSKIFSQFYRAPRPEMANIKGTGLGLSLVKSFIELHKGQVWFESQVGVGSTFGFWLPLAPPAPPDEATTGE